MCSGSVVQGPEVVADSYGNYLVLDRSEILSLFTLIHIQHILIRANRCLQIVEVGWNIGSTLQVAL